MGIEFDLRLLGWQASFEQHFQPYRDAGFVPARVAEEHRDRYAVFCTEGERAAEVTGRLRYTAASRQDFPAVGDWVALQLNGDSTAVIHAVLPRRSLLLRKAAGMLTEAQVIAANLDTLFIVTDVDKDFNPRRLERYLTLARESGVRPVIVLNKADLNARAADLVREIEVVAGGAAVLSVSAMDGNGLDALATHIGEGDTVALIGSSGVGKSTIINRLLGEERLRTSQIRESDGRGRHTTTWRELLLLPSGGIVIDTPGMREVQLWGDEESLDASFHDIEAIAAECRFTDCLHKTEPDCAVRRALEDGTLPEKRFESYLKLRRELRFLEMKQDIRVRLEEQARWKRISRSAQEHMRMKYGGMIARQPGPRSHSPPSGSPLPGNQIRNVVPLPSSDEQVTDPPCSSTICRTTARPEPVPSCFVVKNGSKILRQDLRRDPGAVVVDLDPRAVALRYADDHHLARLAGTTSIAFRIRFRIT